MGERPEAIKLRIVPQPSVPRTIFNQRDSSVPVFIGQHWGEPDWQCGQCGNVLAINVLMICPHEPLNGPVIRELPPASGGETSVLSVSIPRDSYIESEGGSMIVKCALCGSFNELVPADE
jgi:hypothetical protein